MGSIKFTLKVEKREGIIVAAARDLGTSGVSVGGCRNDRELMRWNLLAQRHFGTVMTSINVIMIWRCMGTFLSHFLRNVATPVRNLLASLKTYVLPQCESPNSL